jgi:hypothetical protein
MEVPPDRRDPLADVVAALRRAGLDPALGELADALWLARWARPAGGTEDGTGGPDGSTAVAVTPFQPPPETLPPNQGHSTGVGITDRDGPPATAPTADELIALYPDAQRQPSPRSGPGQEDAVTVGVPEAAALPGVLELQRALRPLQRYRSAARPIRDVLDEEATAERTARAGGILLPVMRAARRGDAAIQLLMDTSSSMCVWERMLSEFQQIFSRLGAFRDVQVHYVHRTPDGGPAIGRRFEPGAGLRSAEQLVDPTGRRVTLLVSDCAGPLWRSGEAHRLLYRLSRHAPVAVLQPLPQRLWARTRLPVTYGTLLRGETGAHSAPPRFVSDSAPYGGGELGERAGAVPIPVLPPVAAALGAWAGLLSGTGSGAVHAAVGWVRPDQPEAPAPRRQAPLSPAELVGRFRSTSSPGAGQLAVYLAAAPLFLPVMQLVQRTMLPESGPAELSEVLLSGLLARKDPEASGAAGRWYEFVDGVRDVLLGPLGRDEALLVLKHCSQYVEQRFGKGGPNFPALAIAQLADVQGSLPLPPARGDDGPAGVPQPFAEVAAKILERFRPHAEPYRSGVVLERPPAAVRRARALVARYESDGMVQYLMDAVQLLRRAAEQERALGHGADPQLAVELSQDLLKLWQLRGGRPLLTEAVDAASAAAVHPGAVRARAALARALHAAAGERRAAGDRSAALDLLRRADRELTTVVAVSGLDRQEALRAALDRVRVLEEQWQLSGDSVLLQESVGILEAYGDIWPADERQPSSLPLAHGRALLSLAAAERDVGRRRLLAAQAAESLEHGEAALRTEGASPEARGPAVLELVDALLLAGEDMEKADDLLEWIRRQVLDGRLRSAGLQRSARLRVQRYRAGGSATELEDAARLFAEAHNSVARERPDYSDLIAEWGEALLERAALPYGARFASQAVRVLRDCRMETPDPDPRLGGRLIMLGRALMLRYRLDDDLVDLREAEHVFGLAALGSADPTVRGTALLELGHAHRQAYAHTGSIEQLDKAASAYRRAAATAREAEEPVEAAAMADIWRQSGYGAPQVPYTDPEATIRVAATAEHWRGVVHEEADKPRAAREAYRTALKEWRRLPGGGGPDERATADRLAGLGSTR